MSDGCCACACYQRGLQDAAYATYSDNLAAAELRAELDAQWHAHVRRYGE